MAALVLQRILMILTFLLLIQKAELVLLRLLPAQTTSKLLNIHLQVAEVTA